MSEDRLAVAVAEARERAAEAVQRGLAAARAEQDRTRARLVPNERCPVCRGDGDHRRAFRFDIEGFFTALDRKRRAERLRWQDISEATGVPKSTFTRMGYGQKPSADSLVRLLVWLGSTDLRPYVREADQ